MSVTLLTISLNFMFNEFALFGDVKGKVYKVHAYEKTTKYLYAYNYIPSNFEGVLIGPSLSDQMMDTKKITNQMIYNLSMDAGNITELKAAVDMVLDKKSIKTLIVCLDPYITNDSGMKSSQINPKEYYSSLGSLFLIKYYLKKYLHLRKGHDSKFWDSSYGYIDTRFKDKDYNSTEMINNSLEDLSKGFFKWTHLLKVDDTAYLQLKTLLETARNKGVLVMAYYYPRPKRIFNNVAYSKEYKNYRTKIDKLLDYDKDIVIDFGTNKYDYIRADDSSYSDWGHLTKYGAEEVMKVINTHLPRN